MSNAPDHKPLIGDDGELLQADNSFPLIGYVEPVPTPQPLPLGIRFAIGLLALVGIFIVGFFFVGLIYTQVASGVNTSRGYTQPQPTEFAAHTAQPHAGFELPAAGLANEWYAGLKGIHGLRWSLDGKYLAFAYQSNHLAVLDTAASQYIFKSLPAVTFDWSPLSSQQFVAADSQKIAIYQNASTPSALTTLQPSAAFQMPPVLIRWSTDGTQIAALSQDRTTIDVFYAADGTLATEKRYLQPTWDILWSPIMSSVEAVQTAGLAYLQPTNRLLNQRQDDVFKWLDDSIAWKHAAYASDGFRIAFTGLDCDLKLMVYDRVGHGDWIKRMEDYDTQNCNDHEAEVTWSPIAEQLATYIRGDDAVYLWKTISGTIRDRFIPTRGSPITAIAWSPDGRYLVIGSDQAVTIWSPNELIRQN